MSKVTPAASLTAKTLHKILANRGFKLFVEGGEVSCYRALQLKILSHTILSIINVRPHWTALVVSIAVFMPLSFNFLVAVMRS
jgi:hypothetical protein